MIQKNEKGQIIVILALAMVAIVAIAALALDGSMGYSDRRKHQNTADSTSLAGAGAAAKEFKKPGTPCQTAKGFAHSAAATFAQTWITDRPFDINDLSNQNGVQGYCGSNYLDVNVMVTQDTETTFAKVIDQDVLTNTVTSTARVTPGHPPGGGAGLVTVSPLCSNKVGGMTFGGLSNVELTNAGIFSNSCLKAEPSNVSVTASEGETIYYVSSDMHTPDTGYDECSGCSDANITPAPEPAPDTIGDYYLEPPKCGPGNYQNAPQNGLVTPGNYKSFSVKGDLTFEPNGLYCIKGDFTVIKGNVTGDGVTLYFEDAATFELNDKYDISLTARNCTYDENCVPDSTCSIPAELRGLLMYFAKPSVLKINGGTDPYFSGTIYAPESDITLNGGSATSFGEFNSQVIGQFIKIDGGAQLKMDIDECGLPSTPPVIELLK